MGSRRSELLAAILTTTTPTFDADLNSIAQIELTVKHFLASEWHRARAFKRGGGAALVSLDGVEAEDRYKLEPSDVASPEAIYDRRWALTVLDQVLMRLEVEQRTAGHAERFEGVKDC